MPEGSVIVYGTKPGRPYHLTVDTNAPLCWNERMSKLDALTPGFDDPNWVKPTLIPESTATGQGRRLCKHCERATS